MGLFNFNNFDVFINTAHKSLVVTLQSQKLTFEFLNEWEHFLEWLSTHNEVNCVYVGPEKGMFLTGLDENEINQYTPKELQKFFIRIQRITIAHFNLPQTLIFDINEGALGVGAEFLLGADIRVARAGCRVKFDHLNQAMIPSSGGIGLLSTLTSPSHARNWVTSAKTLDHIDLKHSGLIQNYYTSGNAEIKEELQVKMNSIAPVARIQLKRSFLETILSDLDKILEREITFSHATLSLNDWKKVIQNKETKDFCSSKQLKEMLKETRMEN